MVKKFLSCHYKKKRRKVRRQEGRKGKRERGRKDGRKSKGRGNGERERGWSPTISILHENWKYSLIMINCFQISILPG